MLRFAWATALATLLVLALNLTLLDPANQTASCAQLELEFESEDFRGSIPEAPALIIGNQRVRYWQAPPQSVSAKTSIRRSAPGLNPSLINLCFPRLVGFYQPSSVIIPVDTAHAVSIDQSDLITSLQGIIDQRAEYSLDFDLWVVAPTTTPRYELTDKALLEQARAADADWTKNKFKVHWVDLQYNFSDATGAADPKLMWPYGNTLNQAGYKRLTDALVTISNERK